MKQKLKNLSTQGGPATGWKNKFQGSILVYSLIILSIMLMTALSIASVTVMERKNAGTTGASNQAFAVADSGSELFLGRIKGKTGTINSVFGTACPTTDKAYTGNVSTVGNFTVTFFKADGTQATCNDLISSITKIKSSGYSNNSSRAIEVAVAAAHDPGIGTCYNSSDMLYIQFAPTCTGVFTQCIVSDLEAAGKLGCLPVMYQYINDVSLTRGCLAGTADWLDVSYVGWTVKSAGGNPGNCSNTGVPGGSMGNRACCHKGG
jgi:hypothetical protein